MAKEIEFVAETKLLLASTICTVTAALIEVAETVFDGCCKKANFAAAPAVMLKAFVLMPVSPLAVARKVKPVPALLMLKLLKVATPATAVTVTVPLRVDEPAASFCIARVIEFVAAATGLSLTSKTCTVMLGEILAPETALVGC